MCRLIVDWKTEIEQQSRSAAVVQVEAAQVEALAGVLSRISHDEPNFQYMIPDDEERFRLLPRFFRIALRARLMCGETYTTRTIDGGALWIGPDSAWAPRRKVRTGFLSMPHELGGLNFTRCLTLGACLAEVRSRLTGGLHWYLEALGVEPAMRRRRIGSRLIEPVLARADFDGVACYLETFNENSLSFYRRHGFRIAAAGKVPAGGPDFWAMIRAPQTPTAATYF